MSPALVLVVLLLLAGYLARRLSRFPEHSSDVLNRFVIDVCLPAVILRVVPSLTLRWDLLILVLVPWSLAALGYLFARLLARSLGFDRHTEAAVFVCTALGNTSFLGFPLVQALLGEAALPFATVYDQLGSFLLLCIVLPVALAQAAGSARPAPRELMKRIATFPPFIALMASLIPWTQPAWFQSVLLQIGNALVPSAMFAVGLRLRITPPKQGLAFVCALATKLVLMPLCAFGIARALNTPHDVLQVVVLESAMPAMISAGAAVMAAGVAVELTAALVGWGILASLVTTSVWAQFLR
ncbi:MAG: AEC family transporter [Myxococcales bacterium]